MLVPSGSVDRTTLVATCRKRGAQSATPNSRVGCECSRLRASCAALDPVLPTIPGSCLWGDGHGAAGRMLEDRPVDGCESSSKPSDVGLVCASRGRDVPLPSMTPRCDGFRKVVQNPALHGIGGLALAHAGSHLLTRRPTHAVFLVPDCEAGRAGFWARGATHCSRRSELAEGSVGQFGDVGTALPVSRLVGTTPTGFAATRHLSRPGRHARACCRCAGTSGARRPSIQRCRTCRTWLRTAAGDCRRVPA